LVELVTHRLLLREFSAADQEAVHAYASDADVVRYSDWGPNSPDETAAFLAGTRLEAVAAPRTDYTLAVVERGFGALIGAAHLRMTSREHRRGEVGYVLARAYWGNGYATEAAGALLGFGFDELGLHKVSATCDPDNVASARVLAKLGLRREGYLREHLLIRGYWRDRRLFAAVSPTW
jgi:RimJ/RimL family protein N-acetyltransferase